MYDETVKDPCRYGLAEHVGEQICVRCGAILADDPVTGMVVKSPDTTNAAGESANKEQI